MSRRLKKAGWRKRLLSPYRGVKSPASDDDSCRAALGGGYRMMLHQKKKKKKLEEAAKSTPRSVAIRELLWEPEAPAPSYLILSSDKHSKLVPQSTFALLVLKLILSTTTTNIKASKEYVQSR